MLITAQRRDIVWPSPAYLVLHNQPVFMPHFPPKIKCKSFSNTLLCIMFLSRASLARWHTVHPALWTLFLSAPARIPKPALPQAKALKWTKVRRPTHVWECWVLRQMKHKLLLLQNEIMAEKEIGCVWVCLSVCVRKSNLLAIISIWLLSRSPFLMDSPTLPPLTQHKF